MKRLSLVELALAGRLRQFSYAGTPQAEAEYAQLGYLVVNGSVYVC